MNASMHAEHFLTRLDRLPRREVDLALELYRDPGLLRFVLGSVTLPAAAERVAISVDDPALGPFLVVTRDGRFVTCLGRGMRPGALPVVTRGQLDAVAAKGGVLRERMALATRLAGRPEAAYTRLLRRMMVASDTVAREDFLAVSAWEPLLRRDFMSLYLSMSEEVLKQTLHLAQPKLPRSRREEALHVYWNLLHATGHMALLASMSGGRRALGAALEGRLPSRAAFTVALSMSGATTFVLKAAWAAGRMGGALLPSYKRGLVQELTQLELLDTVFALLAIGTRTGGRRAEIAKALRAAPANASTAEANKFRTSLTRATADVLLEEPSLNNVRHDLGMRMLAGVPGDFSDAERSDLVRTLPLMTPVNGFTSGHGIAMTLSLVAASARSAPEDFYLPRELARPIHKMWEPTFMLDMLEPKGIVKRTPVTRAVSVGRNEACTCGSGRKYKKCCAGARG